MQPPKPLVRMLERLDEPGDATTIYRALRSQAPTVFCYGSRRCLVSRLAA